MRERVSVSLCQSVCLSVSHFLILENAPFSVLKLTSVQSSDDLSNLNVVLFLKIEAILGEKRVELWP